MRKILLLLFCFSVSLKLSAQWYTFLDFENSADSIINIDTVIMPNNQWQIGTPLKTYFDSAYSTSHALMTDTINPYFGPSVSRAEIKIGNEFGGGWWYGYVNLQFYHKFDTDSLTDGCSIEFSYDGGLTFINVLNYIQTFGAGSINHYNETTSQNYFEDSLPNNKIGLSGNSNGWINTSIFLYNCGGVTWQTDSLIFHFVFRANSDNPASLEGWMIDDIMFNTGYCESVPELNSFSSIVYPNPSSNTVTIDYGLQIGKSELEIRNSLGQIIHQSAITNPKSIIDISQFTQGIYHYILFSEKEKKHSFGKFIKE
ncbi:MAG: hypothetical protein POELPBGB_02129 [Bacteroidia bacterium]|nr:hypothetical protein [Bacteroidia bacterium]